MTASGSDGNWAKGINQMQFERQLGKALAPIERSATIAANFQAASQQRDFRDNLNIRRRLISDVAKLRSPEALQERGRRMKGYTSQARGVAAMAKASDVQGAILDAARMVRKGARTKRLENLQRARGEAELDVQDRVVQAQKERQNLEQKARKRQALFNFFGNYLEGRRQVAGAKAAKKRGIFDTAAGLLVPG